MKNNLKIIQFDGEESYHTVADLICYNMGIEIYKHVKTINEAKEVFKEIEENKFVPQIAIVSNYLEKNYQDGMQIAKKLRELQPNILIVAYTVVVDEDWYDKIAVKSTKDENKTLIKVLTEITGEKFKFANA